MSNTWERDFPRETEELLYYTKLVYDRKLVSAAGGNVSIRCGDNVLITASNDSLRDVRGEHLLLCDLDGRVLEGDPKRKPSKETGFHIGVYRNRPEVHAVIHAHPCFSTIQSMEAERMPRYTDSAKLKLGRVPVIPEALPGSEQLAQYVAQAVSEGTPVFAYLLEAHGMITLGRTMKECFDLAELLEDTAKIAVIKKLLGQ